MKKTTAVLLVNLSTLLWAGNVVLGRALRTAIGPWSLACVRALVASLAFGMLLSTLHRDRGAVISWRTRGLLAGMALTGVVGFQVLQYAGLRYTTAVNAGLVNATGPIIALVLSRFLLGQRFTRTQMIGAFISAAGVLVILSNGSLQALSRLAFNPGDLLVLCAVLSWGLYSVIGKVALTSHSTLWITAVSTALAVPMLVGPAAWEISTFQPKLSLGLAASILYIGTGPSCIAFLAWNEGIRRIGPNGAMAFMNTMPLYTVLVATVTLGEKLNVASLAGASLIIPGCLLTALGDSHTPPPNSGEGAQPHRQSPASVSNRQPHATHEQSGGRHGSVIVSGPLD